MVLRKQPKSLLLEFTDADGEPFTYALQSQYVTWSRDKAENAKVQRRGFAVVPDFAGTAHCYCGSTLELAKGDLLEWHRAPSMEAMLRAYIIRSRIRQIEQFLLIQPYSPMLFAQGTLPGPSLLLQAQKGELDEEQLRQAWADVDTRESEQKIKNANWPWEMQLPCQQCTIRDAHDTVVKPLKAFIANKNLDEAWAMIAQGGDMICFKCDQQLFTKKRAKVLAMLCDSCESAPFPKKKQKVFIFSLTSCERTCWRHGV